MAQNPPGIIPSVDEHYKRTATRIAQIQSHLQGAAGQRLKNKVCIITGTGSLHGIGRASALLFAHEGACHLYLVDYCPDNLPDLESNLKQSYPEVKVTTIQADAADENAIASVCKLAIDEEGRLDVFFANAGIINTQMIDHLTSEGFMQTLRVNVLSCFLAVKHGSQAMKRINPAKGKTLSGGSIILTASIAGLRSGAGTTDYSASKAAVNSIAKTSAYQLQKTDIRVNTICPGLIETNMTKGMFDLARQRGTSGKLGQLNPLGRYGVPIEVAHMALFLASDESSYINGQNIAVDGGLSASHPVIPGRVA